MIDLPLHINMDTLNTPHNIILTLPIILNRDYNMIVFALFNRVLQL